MSLTFKERLLNRYWNSERKLLDLPFSESFALVKYVYGLGCLIEDFDNYVGDETELSEWFELLATEEYSNLRSVVVTGLSEAYVTENKYPSYGDVVNVVFKGFGKHLLESAAMLNSVKGVRLEVSKYAYPGQFTFYIPPTEITLEFSNKVWEHVHLE